MGLTRKDLDEIATIVEVKTKSILCSVDWLEQLTEKVFKQMNARFENKLKSQMAEITILKSQIENIQTDNLKLHSMVEQLEQNRRLKNIRIHNLKVNDPRKVVETTLNFFKEKLKIRSLSASDIESCYVIKNKRNMDRNESEDSNRLPAMFVGFKDKAMQTEILKCRKLLKSSGIYIREDLTKHRQSIVAAAIEVFPKNCVWCSNGTVLVKHEGTIHRLINKEDINQLVPDRQPSD
ncbi:unnamed protein product [Phaedon cochleariae]|uniref:Uncharacterized protein n=1 Tax=Phaedon cochleariae TaxID=80249 RepID=A0A9N9X5V3_PHACE|nr:unnamed protein product [Phaedon cochleariae]